VNIVYTVRPDSPQAPLAQLLQLPLGLDIWQVRGDHVVLRADEPQAARLRQIGYTTEEIVETETHISTFTTAEAIAAYHSAETLEGDIR
jgi:carboxypeptidase T